MRKKAKLCQFPGCGHVAKVSSELDTHHILPRSMGGVDMGWNLMDVCPGCHRKINVPGCRAGIHTLSIPGSIIVLGYLKTSDGRGLHYKELATGQECVYYLDSKSISKLEKPLLG